MPSFGHLDKTAHLFVHLTRPAPNSGPLRNLLPGISSYPQKLRPGGTLFFGTAKSRDRNLDRVPDQGGFRSTLNTCQAFVVMCLSLSYLSMRCDDGAMRGRCDGAMRRRGNPNENWTSETSEQCSPTPLWNKTKHPLSITTQNVSAF